MLSWLTKYSEMKSALGDYLSASEALLHLHAGLLIFFISSLLFRRRMRSLVPIGLVYAFAIGNEIIDVLTPDYVANSFGAFVDILNTVAWPTLLFLLARRRLLGGKGRQ